ncbi:MAG: SDR family oxidoreductase [Chloroflexi bacterium]|nr:SDR family oxidoreductase [Chloroflexota bacterium]
MLLEGKKALITGARKGIGRGIAVRFAQEGADVGIADIVDDAETQKTVDLIRAEGRSGELFVADVSTTSGIGSLYERHLEKFGRIDILVNNAIMPDQSAGFIDMTEAYWDRMIDLTLKGYFFMAQRAAQEMVKQGSGGRILSLSSVHGYRAWPNDTAYGICKAGLRRMVQSMSADLAGHGITSNCIAPGYIDNKIPEGDSLESPPMTMEQMPRLVAYVGSHRGGVPSDIAKMAVVLCSELGDYVNGETVLVDGGMIGAGTPEAIRSVTD